MTDLHVFAPEPGEDDHGKVCLADCWGVLRILTAEDARELANALLQRAVDAEQPPGTAAFDQVLVFVGEDGTPVVQIDTQPDSGRVRINLNDTPAWDGDPDHPPGRHVR